MLGVKETEMWWNDVIPGFNPSGVLHVGANSGEERFIYSEAGLAVVWIEGRLEAFQELQKNITDFPNQSAHHFTVSAIDYQPVTFRILDNEDSSTVLPLTVLHDQHYGFQVVEERHEIGRRIDAYFDEFHEPLLAKCDLLVIDVQGGEAIVLNSLGGGIEPFHAAKIEVSVFTPYIGGATLKQIDSFMLSKGFIRQSMSLGGLSGDAVYVRADKISNVSRVYMWVSRNLACILRTRILRKLARFLRRNIYLKSLSFCSHSKR